MTVDLDEAVFGGFDGTTSVVGVVAGVTVSAGHVLAAALGLAVASAVGMAAGEFLSDDTRSGARAAVMGLATLVGTLVPIAPYVLGLSHPLAWCIALVLGVGLMVARLRSDHRWPRAQLETLGLLAIAAGATVLVTLATGVSG